MSVDGVDLSFRLFRYFLRKMLMKNKLQFLGIAATLTMSLGYTGIAQAATMTTTGVWTQVTGNPSNGPNGVGTSQISWGQPADGLGQSAYKFQGVSNISMPVDNSNFLLGTFTHNNYAIYLPSITGANLALNLNISGNLSKTFNFFFNHNETPNDGVNGICPDTPGYATPCPDVVSIPSASSTETIDIGGLAYKLVINGFLQNGNLVNQFITKEAKANSAQLYAHLEKVTVTQAVAVPEPSAIFGITALGFGAFLKRKQFESAKSKVNA